MCLSFRVNYRWEGRMFHIHVTKLMNDVSKFEKQIFTISQMHFSKHRLIWFPISDSDRREWRRNFMRWFIILIISRTASWNAIGWICCNFDWDLTDIQIEIDMWFWLWWMSWILHENHNKEFEVIHNFHDFESNLRKCNCAYRLQSWLRFDWNCHWNRNWNAIVMGRSDLYLAKHSQQRTWSLLTIFMILKTASENEVYLVCCHFDCIEIEIEIAIEIKIEIRLEIAIRLWLWFRLSFWLCRMNWIWRNSDSKEFEQSS
jgi:hypothetical protein